jgi:hypothetical protein
LGFSRDGERRDGERFRITCPVTMLFRNKRAKVGEQRGRIRDIGIRGASVYAPVPLDVGTHVTLMVEFPDGAGNVTTAQFEGLVTRAEVVPAYETAVVFRHRGRFLRTTMAELLTRLPSEDEHKASDPKVCES